MSLNLLTFYFLTFSYIFYHLSQQWLFGDKQQSALKLSNNNTSTHFGFAFLKNDKWYKNMLIVNIEINAQI